MCSNKGNRAASFLYIHVSVSDLYDPKIGLPIWRQQKRHTDVNPHMNVEIGKQNIIILFWKLWGSAVSFLGIHEVEPDILYWILAGPSFTVQDSQLSCNTRTLIGLFSSIVFESVFFSFSSQILSPWLGDVVNYGIGFSIVSPNQGLRIWLRVTSQEGFVPGIIWAHERAHRKCRSKEDLAAEWFERLTAVHI